MTAIIQIGNTDNKLTQQDWSAFAADLRLLVSRLGGQVHFDGASEATRPWQNLCIVLEHPDMTGMRLALGRLAAKYRQDSIALTVGETEFVAAVPN